MPSTVFITGASSGFGKAIATRFAQNNYRLILTGRRKELLDEHAHLLNATYGVEIINLYFDVREKLEVSDAISSLQESWRKIDILINNAGLAAGFDLIQEGSMDDWDQMIDTNVKGLLYVTKEILPYMIKSRSGHIINLGSTASKYVYEKGNVYCATKFAVDALSQAMRIDLLRENIKVTSIHPGAAETEFSMIRFKGDLEKAKAIYKGYQPLTAGDIADAVYYCATRPPHVCISEVMITPAAQANPFYIDRK